ncbi:MAG: hypothetical protein ACI4JI_08585 [Ruminiclostridium sp.]
MHYQAVNDDLLDGRFEFRQSGTFRVLSEYARIKVIIALVAELFAAYYTISVIFFGGAASNNSSIIVIRIALGVILPVLPLWYMAIVAGGEEQYKYSADNHVMRIASKRHTYIFRYEDVQSVTYEPLKFFCKRKGYTVKIIAKNCEASFRYIMPDSAEFQNTMSTPFYILERARMKTQDKSDRF